MKEAFEIRPFTAFRSGWIRASRLRLRFGAVGHVLARLAGHSMVLVRIGRTYSSASPPAPTWCE
jgi:hypothetical protein